jgi:hypothetical protein
MQFKASVKQFFWSVAACMCVYFTSVNGMCQDLTERPSLEPLEIFVKTNSADPLILDFSITNKSSQELRVDDDGVPWDSKPYQLEASRILQPGNKLLGLTPILLMIHSSPFQLRIHPQSEEVGSINLKNFFEEITEVHATNDILVRWRVKLTNGDAKKDVSGKLIISRR